jgi:hypothetical protein
MGGDGNRENEKSTAQQVSEVLQSIENEREEQQPRELPSSKTEYQRFVEETGGPLEIDGFKNVTQSAYRSCCFEFPFRNFLPIIEKWPNTKGRQLWPAMAHLASQYRWRLQQFEEIGKEPSPKEISELLSTIASAAELLRSSLVTLQKRSFQPSDGSAPLARQHLQWIDQFIAQAASGIVLQDVDQNPTVMAAAHLGRDSFLQNTMCVEAAATTAKSRLNEGLLKRPKRGPDNRALRALVTRAKPVWKSLTGRDPSVNKVHKKDQEEPDFVLFIQELGDIAGGPRPSFKQVQTAFRRARPPV